MLGALIVLQLAAPAAPPGLDGFDLADVPRAARSCDDPGLAPGDILVCVGREGGAPPLGDPVETELLLPRAETGIFGGGRASIDAEQVELMPGIVSQRALVTFRWPF